MISQSLQMDNSPLNQSQIQLKELYIELERKDLVIKNLQSQLLSAQTQFDILLSSKKEEINSQSTNLQSQVFKRDKAISEKDKEWKNWNNDLTLLKKEIINRNSELSTWKEDIAELEIKNKNYHLRINAKDEELWKNKSEFENQLSLVRKEKKVTEAKAAQWVEIIKQYSKELAQTSIHIDSIETEKKTLKTFNEKWVLKNEENEKLIKDYKTELSSVNDMYKDNQHLSQIWNKLQRDFENAQNEKLHSQKEINDLQEELKTVKEANIKLNVFKSGYETISKENISLKEEISKWEVSNSINIKRANESENELTSLSKRINQCISGWVEWVETYFGVYYDSAIGEIPQDKIENIKINLLYECWSKKRSKINESISQYENSVKDRNKNINDLIAKSESIQMDNKKISSLYNSIKEKDRCLEEENKSLKKSLESLQNSINEWIGEREKIGKEFNIYYSQVESEVSKEINTILNNPKLSHFSNNFKSQTTKSPHSRLGNSNSITSLIIFINDLILEYEKIIYWKDENKTLAKEISKLQGDKMEMEQRYINKFSDKEKEFNMQMSNIKAMSESIYSNKIKDCYAELEMKRKKDNEEVINLTNTINLLQKRLVNLQTEIELKDMQIKSQEQIITRRVNKQNNESGSNIWGDETWIHSWEIDKTKWINDNIILINDNQKLQTEMNIMNEALQDKEYKINELIRQLNEKEWSIANRNSNMNNNSK